MYFYKTGYYSYEDSCFHELFHEKLFTQEEFEDMFVEACLDILIDKRNEIGSLQHVKEEGGYSEFTIEEYTSGDYLKGWQGEEGEFPTLEAYLERYGHRQWARLGYIHREISDLLIEKHGFKKVEYQAEVSADGWGGIVDKERNFGEDEKILDRIMEEYWKRKKK